MKPLRVSSLDYQHVDGNGDQVIVVWDRDRPEGVADLVGQTVDIDGVPYSVLEVENPSRPIRLGETIVFWVTAA
jgi:hypothetical protein